MSDRLNIPADIAPYLFKNKLRKEFQLFCCLKLQQNSRITDVKAALEACAPFCGLKYRTLRKYFNRLVDMHWIGTDTYGNYWFRSFRYVRTKYRSNSKRFVAITIENIPGIDEFITGLDVANRMKNQQTLQHMAQHKRRKTQALTKTDDAEQREYLLTANYCGISSESLGNKLGISRSAAQRHLRALNKRRYAKVRRHMKKIASSLSETDIRLLKKSELYENHKLRVKETPASRRNRFNFNKQFDLYIQLHNEYISNMELKVQRKWVLMGN